MNQYRDMYNILVNKINEIIDVIYQVEQFDTVAFQELNEYMNNILVELENVNIDELIGEIDHIKEDLQHLKDMGE